MLFPFAHPLYVMAKPAGARCNLHCDYCYYLEKQGLYAGRADAQEPMEMSDALLERFTQQFIEAQTTPQVVFQWHGGEPLLRPIAFYEKALRLQQKYANGRHIDNALQTNGTLLTDEWCRFFHDHHFLIGLSIDGPRRHHDTYRSNLNGKGSFERVMKGIMLLEKHRVEWNAMAVVNDRNVHEPEAFYAFFKSIGARYVQFTPIVERLVETPEGSTRLASAADTTWRDIMPGSVTPEAYGDFLCRLFDAWYPHDVGEMFIQFFESTLAGWMGVPPGVCSMAETCGHAAVMEHNGDVYACDHFVFPEYYLGNLHKQTLIEMMYSPRQQAFGRAKKSALPLQCRQCRWLSLCHGGCPKDRFALTSDGTSGLNYLCGAYRKFFAHTAIAMQMLSKDL